MSYDAWGAGKDMRAPEGYVTEETYEELKECYSEVIEFLVRQKKWLDGETEHDDDLEKMMYADLVILIEKGGIEL